MLICELSSTLWRLRCILHYVPPPRGRLLVVVEKMYSVPSELVLLALLAADFDTGFGPAPLAKESVSDSEMSPCN